MFFRLKIPLILSIGRKIMKNNSTAKFLSIALALSAILGATAFYYGTKSAKYERYLTHMSDKAYSEIISGLENAASSLNKMQYASKGSYLNTLAANVWKEASSAKASLALLPLSDVELEQTEKFISQAGAYAYSILQRGITPDTKSSISVLSSTANELTQKLFEVKERVNNGEISFNLLSSSDNSQPTDLSQSISDIETEFPQMGTLIYDGPFSDHIEKLTPALTENAPSVTQEVALGNAIAFSNDKSLAFTQEGGDKIPVYSFSSKNGTSVQVTKNGGFIVYMTKDNESKVENITADNAVGIAKNFLSQNGYKNMSESYFTIYSNNITINFAYLENGIKVYTDLIKVGVSLDSGEIISFESRGYIMSHKDRLLTRPALTLSDAQAKLSPSFNVIESSMAIIPTSGSNEIFCYEFLCSTQDNQRVLVYIDALTGEEENMLILIENENGTLTI